jgi:oxygen-independent coproporphyrinogen III oxidase
LKAQVHLYIHIPYCKQACHYCDFHFSTRLGSIPQMVEAIKKEIRLRENFFNSNRLDTIYFGGGSPSILALNHFEDLIKEISENFDLKNLKEFTLEVNPDDVNLEHLLAWKSLGVNRLSLGIQTFDTQILKHMNRAHDGTAALESLYYVQEVFHENYSVDLIINRIADPVFSRESLEKDFETLKGFTFKHLSAYSLTIESKTVYAKMLINKQISEQEDHEQIFQYQLLQHRAKEMGFEQYEVSNFARNEKYAQHNTAYWQNKPYLGIGPAAHSFKGNTRFFNISSNLNYIKKINSGLLAHDIEHLTEYDLFNEAVLCGLRTKWGLEKSIVENCSILDQEYLQNLESLKSQGKIIETGGRLIIPDSFRYQNDGISSEMMLINPS